MEHRGEHESAVRWPEGLAALSVVRGAAESARPGAHARNVPRDEAARLLRSGPVVVCHAAMTARRLGQDAPMRRPDLYDVMELWAFARPARFAAPSVKGLAAQLGLDAGEACAVLFSAAERLLGDLAAQPLSERVAALPLALTLQRAGWSWGAMVVTALEREGLPDARPPTDGLRVWAELAEWSDDGAPAPPGSLPISGGEAREALTAILGAAGLDEARPEQADFAAAAAGAFQPREEEGAPRLVLAEAGTGVGKTLAYLAAAKAWSEKNAGAVWVSTYTKALQRQIARDFAHLYPDRDERARKAAVRKGRENYLCLLNFEDRVKAAAAGGADLVALGLIARWAGASRDGDMVGGDFPAWLPTLFPSPAGRALPLQSLTDTRGECVHAACPHYKCCFIEKAVRKARRADVVVANHALVMTMAAFARSEIDPADAAAQGQFAPRLVFDEGHHVFDAADSAFSAFLSAREAADLRRWLRGPESARRRGRGLEERLSDLIMNDQDASDALTEALAAARALPDDGWPQRISPRGEGGVPKGAAERFLAGAAQQLRARADWSGEGDVECPLEPPIEGLIELAGALAADLKTLENALNRLANALAARLSEGAEDLISAERIRLEGAVRGLRRRARLQLPGWRSALTALSEPTPAQFVDRLTAKRAFGRVLDLGLERRWIDPSEPFAEIVLRPVHGALFASATLTDREPDAEAELRWADAAQLMGADRFARAPELFEVASPFPYAEATKVLVVGDLDRDDPDQAAGAMQALVEAAGGGALLLFTAIKRLKASYARLAGPLEAQGFPVFAQHIDPLDPGTLVDLFRVEENGVLFGTDAVRDGVDVPGRALRLIVFDRAPWPVPDLVHKARRAHFGKGWDDRIARAKLRQAYGRLVRRAGDRGVFVILDKRTPTRLFSSFPDGVGPERVGLAEAIATTRAFLAP